MDKDFIPKIIQNKNVVMFITAIFFMSGILSYFNNHAVLAVIIISSILIILNLFKVISHKYILLWALVFYLGFFNASIRIKNEDDLVKIAPADSTIIGQIVTIPNGDTPGKIKFFLNTTNVNENEIHSKTLVYMTSENNDFSNLKIGNTYKINGKLRVPFKASNPSQFDYGKYLQNFHTHTVFYTDYKNCEVINTKLDLKWRFIQELNNVRNRILTTHSKYLKSPNLEILGGIVFGDDAIAPPDYIKDTFKNSGLLHILAASGMNVAFIYFFWYVILRRLKVPVKFIITSGIFVIVLYTFMTGLGASVIRAALMLIFVLIGKLIDRDSHSISLLAFVASLMLLYNPSYINDVGFQLSFIVTFGLLTTANAIFELIKKSKIPDWLCAELLIPIVAQLWVAPLQMFYFNTISTYSIIANIAIMPFLSVISFLGFLSSLISLITPVAKYICAATDCILNYCLNVLVNISNFFSALPNSLIETTHPVVAQIILYYIILLAITFMIKFGFSKKRVIITASAILVLIISTFSIPNNNGEIITFDVQNADAFLIKSPANKYFIIDTGKAPYNDGKSQAEVIILKYLKDKGIKELEGLIITHFDSDHSGGAPDIINKIIVKNVYINTLDSDSYTSNNIFNALKYNNIKPILAENNKIIYNEPNFKLTTYKPIGENDNDKSIITLLSYNDFQMLFTGDAGISSYNSIKKDIPYEKVEVLKVGHHGAAGVVDNAMISTLNPDISIISTGKNIFGHPNNSTLDVLRNTDIYRTDRQNSIKISVHNNEYNVYTFNIKSKKYKLFKNYKIDNAS